MKAQQNARKYSGVNLFEFFKQRQSTEPDIQGITYEMKKHRQLLAKNKKHRSFSENDGPKTVKVSRLSINTLRGLKSKQPHRQSLFCKMLGDANDVLENPLIVKLLSDKS